jgi:hypothetical protein
MCFAPNGTAPVDLFNVKAGQQFELKLHDHTDKKYVQSKTEKSLSPAKED